jgi:GT2 family glycosyltransferase
LEVFLVDDGSTDGTSEAISKKYPEVNIITGDGNLFWAGGMRLAFSETENKQDFKAYLLLNDDTVLESDFLLKLLETETYCFKKYKKGGLYSGSTIDRSTGEISYGGNVLTKGLDHPRHQLLKPSSVPQACHLTNANILYVDKGVIEAIGFFSKEFTHSFADYDFSLRAFKAGFPVYISRGVCGYCKDDHGNNWSSSKSLKKRIAYLKSPTGLGYREYLIYSRRHFPKYITSTFIKLWAKTLAPGLWEMKTKYINRKVYETNS